MTTFQRRYINTLRYATPVVLLILGTALIFVSYPEGRAFLEFLGITAIRTGY